jgi:hypothetical protein
MKPFEDLTEDELCGLTEPQIARYYDMICAEQGIGFLPDEPVKPAQVTFEANVTIYNVGSYLHFLDAAEAAAVAQLINQCTSRTDTEWTHIPRCPVNHKLSNLSDREMVVSPSQVFSEARWQEIRQRVEAVKEAERVYERDEKHYKDILARRNRATEWMREQIAEARDKGRRRDTLRNEFQRYVDLADGDVRIAWRFLVKTQPDARELVPDLEPENPLPVEPVESLPAPSDADSSDIPI